MTCVSMSNYTFLYIALMSIKEQAGSGMTTNYCEHSKQLVWLKLVQDTIRLLGSA